ncbi:MAG: hypothetical protein AB1449_13200 [Chloroflexota bacterium]
MRTRWWRPWLRRAALSLATAAAAFWVFAVAVSFIGPNASPGLEGILLAGLVGLSGLGLILAWQWQGLGSLLLLIGGAGLSLFALLVARRNQAVITLLLGGPFLLSGAMLRLSLSRGFGENKPNGGPGGS